MKKYIRAMASPREKVMNKAKFYSSDLMEHIIKIMLYHDIRESTVPHWIGEIANWLSIVDKLEMKPKNKKLSPKDLEYTLFSEMGDSVNDYRAALNEFYYMNRRGKFNSGDRESYPDFNANDPDLAELLMDICYEIMNSVTPLLIDKDDHSMQEYSRIIRKALELHL